MANKIIICSNIPGAGKDTFADYLVEKYGFVKLAFADGIYKIAREVFGMKQKNRRLLQDIGEKMREIESDVWVNDTMNRANKQVDTYDNPVVISDLRRQNEFDRAIEEGFLPIRIVCDRNVAINRIMQRDGVCDESLLDNESETGTRDIPMLEIKNNGTVEEFYSKIDDFLEEMNVVGELCNSRMEKFFSQYCS